MSAYSLDLREKIVESVKKGVSKTETARRFGVDRATVKRFCKQLDERGTLEPRKAPGKRPKLDEKATKLLAKDLEERPWATLLLTALEDQSHRTVGVSTLMILCDDLKTRDRGTMQLAHVSMWPHPATVMKSE
jgi:transposase